MGFYSNVQIVAESKAYDELKEVFEKYKEQYSLKPNYQYHADTCYGVITFDWIKWYEEYSFVKETQELIEKYQDDSFSYTVGYGCKMIILNEDDTNETYSNHRGDDVFENFEILVSIENPYDVPPDLTDWEKYLRYLNLWVSKQWTKDNEGAEHFTYKEWKRLNAQSGDKELV